MHAAIRTSLVADRCSWRGAAAMPGRARARRGRRRARDDRSWPRWATRSPPARRRGTPTEGVRRQAGASDPQSQYEYWAERRLRGVRFRNCGVFGERTDEIARRLDRCARGAKVLIVQGGINDIAQGKGIEGAARNLRAWSRAGRRLGLRVALVEVLPWNNGYPRADPQIRALNRRIGAIGRDTAACPCTPGTTRLESPREPGRMRAELTARRRPPIGRGLPAPGRRRAPTAPLAPSRARTPRRSSARSACR